MRRILIVITFFIVTGLKAQVTFPVNGIADPFQKAYAFINATIVKDASNTLSNAVLIIREKKIVSIGVGTAIPNDAVVIDCKGKYIYPSFIDIYSDYGIPVQQRTQAGFNFNAPAQLTSNTKGAYGWNQAVRPEINASEIFTVDDAKASTLREAGFGTVLSHQKDG